MRHTPELRDQASRRVRRWTTGLVAGATALTAAFAGIAAQSTHTTKHVVQRVTTAKKQVTAPTPSLVASGTAPSQQSTPQQPQTQTPAVTPSSSPPVVVGGGS